MQDIFTFSLVAVRFPHQFKSWFTRKLAIIYLTLALMISLLLTLWHWVGCLSLEHPEGKYNSYDHTRWPMEVGMVIVFLDFLLPFLILVVSNVLLFLEFRQRSQATEKEEMRDVLIMRILFVTILLLLVCHSPIVIFKLVLEPFYQVSSWITEHITIICVIINSSANFVIFYVMAKEFRAWTREIFCS